MFCASCTEPTEVSPCARCGHEPRLAGRYALLEVLGRGAAGTTWRALGPDGPVAIKETARGRGDAAKASELAEREANVLQQLHHPQIPRFVERLETEASRTHHLWLVQELIPGTNLREEPETRRWSEEEVLGLIADLCAPLGHLHGRSPPIIQVRPGDVTATTVDPALQPAARTGHGNPFPPVSAAVAETTCQVDAVVGTDGLVYSATVSNCPLPYHASVQADLEGTTFPKPAAPAVAHLERGFGWAVNGRQR